MASDRKQSRSKQSASHRSYFLPVLLAYLFGYITASFFAWDDVKSMMGAKLVSQGTLVQTASQKENLPKPKFEFYTLLSEESTTSSQKNTSPLKASAKKSLPQVPVETAKPVAENKIKSQPSSAYLVQVASFRNQADAERMKASLILKDFKVMVTHVHRNQKDWYRVMIGPYNSRIDAEKAQVSIARSEHVMGMIRKMDA